MNAESVGRRIAATPQVKPADRVLSLSVTVVAQTVGVLVASWAGGVLWTEGLTLDVLGIGVVGASMIGLSAVALQWSPFGMIIGGLLHLVCWLGLTFLPREVNIFVLGPLELLRLDGSEDLLTGLTAHTESGTVILAPFMLAYGIGRGARRRFSAGTAVLVGLAAVAAVVVWPAVVTTRYHRIFIDGVGSRLGWALVTMAALLIIAFTLHRVNRLWCDVLPGAVLMAVGWLVQWPGLYVELAWLPPNARFASSVYAGPFTAFFVGIAIVVMGIIARLARDDG